MYFWDLTIDTVSTIVIIIAIGLSVDYASHVGHTFLVKSGSRKGNYQYFQTFIQSYNGLKAL
jgi:predicted RND superfamily exporter protein